MQPGTYRIIPVKAKAHTVFALVSPEDYEAVSAHRWYLTHGYAIRRTPRPESRTVYMARELLGVEPADPREVDHINRDRLDNRRSNLRAISKAENRRNVSAQAGTSRYRGVCWGKNRWKAQATFERRNHYLGTFLGEDDAARAVNAFWVQRGYPAPNEISAAAA